MHIKMEWSKKKHNESLKDTGLEVCVSERDVIKKNQRPSSAIVACIVCTCHFHMDRLRFHSTTVDVEEGTD